MLNSFSELLIVYKKYELDAVVKIEVLKVPSKPLTQSEVRQHMQAFTIDPTSASDLDDALSLVRESDDMYTMSVLITNVGRQLEQGSELDEIAYKHGNSVYGKEFQPMIPDDNMRQNLSLNPNEDRDVIIVSANVTLSENGTVISVNTADIKEGKLISQLRLSYLEAQNLLNECFSDHLQKKIDQYSGQPGLVQSLQLLYKIAMYLRVRRLDRAAYAYKEKEKLSWQAHLLVEELMIWANRTVAEKICQHKESQAVLLRQAGPDLQKLSDFRSQYADVIAHSVALSAFDTIVGTNTSKSRLLIPHTTLRQLHEAIQTRNAFQLQRLLTTDSLYPQLAAAERCLKSISNKAEYVCSDTLIVGSSSPFCHHSLCLDYYTHFTSPIRRYCDVVVQRLLLFNLGQYSAEEYSAENLKKICLHLNMRSRDTKKYTRGVNQLNLAQQLQESCEETCAYVNKVGNRFEVDIPDVEYRSCMKRELDTGFHVSALVCKKGDDGILKWKVSIYSFGGNDFILKNPQLRQFRDFKKSEDTTELAETATTNIAVFYRRPEDDSQHASFKTSTEDLFLKRKDILFKLQMRATQIHKLVDIDPEQWQSVIKKIDDLTDDTIQEISALLPEGSTQRQDDQQVHDQVTVERFQKSPIVKCEVACKLGSNSIVSVWLGQTLLREPILYPCLQLMEVSPELRICLQHNKHPAECFSDTQLQQASKEKYKSIEEYVQLWKKVFLAEAAENSVINREKQLILLKAAPLIWPKLAMPETSTEDFVVPQGLVTLTILPKDRHFLQYNVQINSGDLVCVRYDVKNKDPEQCCKAVYHLAVKNVIEPEKEKTKEKEPQATLDKKELVIEMEAISRNSCQISSKMAKILRRNHDICKYPCELQIINLQESFK